MSNMSENDIGDPSNPNMERQDSVESLSSLNFSDTHSDSSDSWNLEVTDGGQLPHDASSLETRGTETTNAQTSAGPSDGSEKFDFRSDEGLAADIGPPVENTESANMNVSFMHNSLPHDKIQAPRYGPVTYTGLAVGKSPDLVSSPCSLSPLCGSLEALASEDSSLFVDLNKGRIQRSNDKEEERAYKRRQPKQGFVKYGRDSLMLPVDTTFRKGLESKYDVSDDDESGSGKDEDELSEYQPRFTRPWKGKRPIARAPTIPSSTSTCYTVATAVDDLNNMTFEELNRTLLKEKILTKREEREKIKYEKIRIKHETTTSQLKKEKLRLEIQKLKMDARNAGK